MVYIYGLACPNSGRIRYIGKSDNPTRRLSAHISSAVRRAYDHHTARWIRRLVAMGKNPELRILCAVSDGEDWRVVEREWIAKARAEGWPITNTTAGGEGLDYLDPAAASAYRENHRAAMRAWAATPSGRLSIERMRAFSNEPEARSRRSASQRMAWSDPAKKEKLRAAITQAQRKPETAEKRSKSSKAAWATKHDEIVSRIWTPEARAKHKMAKVAAWADPEVGSKLRAIHASPEVRAKKSEGARRRSTPEYRAMMAERTRISWEKRRKIKGA